MNTRAGSIWAGYQTPWEKLVYAITVGQKYLLENTTLGIPALVQSEGWCLLMCHPCCWLVVALVGLHGFTDNGTIFPSPVGLAASFDSLLVRDIANVVATEAEGLGINQVFAPVLDLGRELRWGRVEEGFGESPYLTGELGYAFVHGIQDGRRRNTSSTAIARVAATCKHFAAFGSPQGGLWVFDSFELPSFHTEIGEEILPRSQEVKESLEPHIYDPSIRRVWTRFLSWLLMPAMMASLLSQTLVRGIIVRS